PRSQTSADRVNAVRRSEAGCPCPAPAGTGRKLRNALVVDVHADVATVLAPDCGRDRDMAHVLPTRDVPEQVPSSVRREGAAQLRNRRPLDAPGRGSDLGRPDVEDDLLRVRDPEAEGRGRMLRGEMNRPDTRSTGESKPGDRCCENHGCCEAEKLFHA